LPRIAKPLTALEVKRLDAPGLHAVGTVPGLYLRVLPPPSSGRLWTLRLVVGQKRRDLGLGAYPAGRWPRRSRLPATSARQFCRAGTR